jgi:hypothetical protein
MENARNYFREPGQLVLVGSGKRTDPIYVRWTPDGSEHEFRDEIEMHARSRLFVLGVYDANRLDATMFLDFNEDSRLYGCCFARTDAFAESLRVLKKSGAKWFDAAVAERNKREYAARMAKNQEPKEAGGRQSSQRRTRSAKPTAAKRPAITTSAKRRAA